MAITKTWSSVTPEVIPVDGTALVTLGVSAMPGPLTEPVDIVLVLEATGTMGTFIKEEMRVGARALVNRVAVATGSEYYLPFGQGVRMGLVVYNSQAVMSIRLTAESIEMDAGITAIDSRDTGVDQASALKLATDMLAASTGKKAIIIFSYSAATMGGDGQAEADAAKAAGIEIYGLGPETRRADMTRWVSKPENFYLCINVGGESMAVTFDLVGDRLTAGTTTDAVLTSEVGGDFTLVRIISSTRGTASLTDARSLTWQLGSLGATGPETAELVYEIRHTGTVLGRKPATAVNLLTTSGEADRIIENPEVIVIAACGSGGTYVPEGCPEPVEIIVPGCMDAARADMGAVGLASLGRVVQVDFLLKGVCPGKRVAVTLLLEEIDGQGKASPRGAKHLLIPARTGTACEDVAIKCVEFSVPEVLDPSGNLGSICNSRSFRVRAVANYVDTDFVCCESVGQIM